MLAWFESPERKWFGKELNPACKPYAAIVQDYEHLGRQMRQVVAYPANKDATFLFGTDTPSAPTYGNLPGLNGFLEMKQLQKAECRWFRFFEPPPSTTPANSRWNHR